MRKVKYEKQDQTELKFGVEWATNLKEVTGWVSNIKSYSVYDENEKEHTSLLIYVMREDGQFLKCQLQFAPYFFVCPESEQVDEMMMQLESKYEKQVIKLEKVSKVDLEQINHLAGLKKTYIKLTFRTIADLVQVRNSLKGYELREYDVPYHCRVCIDTGIRCGKWFTFHLNERLVTEVVERNDIVGKPDFVYLAFDIETTKFPLKFPDSKIDEIMMISMCYEGVAVLITNRQVVGQDVESFEYAPKPEFHVEVEVYNEKDERGCIMRFFEIIFELKPTAISSFNGDRFDWPFIEDRCVELGI